MVNIENITVLYLDDNVQIRKQYALLMRENGLKVLEAENVSVAHELFGMHKVDFILMDIIFPHENGLDFIRYLRQKERLIPIVITTSIVDQKILLDAINLDITRYLIKPFKDNDLLEVLHVVIKKLFMNHTVKFSYLKDGYYYDPINKSLNDLEGKRTLLSRKEYRFMELLLSNREKTIPYSVIETAIWEGSYMSIDALRTLVRGIRKKTYPTIISNHNGIGYKINLN
ncbi:MAG: response regulator [Ignavibacteria bacterium]|nr:response regulator [Ignavibacteria bacterium]